MKSGILVLALLMIALVALPLTAFPVSTSDTAASSGQGWDGHPHRSGAGQPVVPGRGMMQGNGPGPGPGPFPHGERRGCESSPESGVQQELRRDPFDWKSLARTIRFRAFRRLSVKNILDHEKRHLIYTAILMNPGIEPAALSALTGVNLHTLRYHAGYLVRLHKVVCVEQGGCIHFFENHGRFGLHEQRKILYERYPATHMILMLVGSRPGITRGEIAGELGIAGPSVTRWMQRLIGEGIVSEVRDGRRVLYYSAAGQMPEPLPS